MSTSKTLNLNISAYVNAVAFKGLPLDVGSCFM